MPRTKRHPPLSDQFPCFRAILYLLYPAALVDISNRDVLPDLGSWVEQLFRVCYRRLRRQPLDQMLIGLRDNPAFVRTALRLRRVNPGGIAEDLGGQILCGS